MQSMQAPCYQLYALSEPATAPPPKPGMIRVTSGGGPVSLVHLVSVNILVNRHCFAQLALSCPIGMREAPHLTSKQRSTH